MPRLLDQLLNSLEPIALIASFIAVLVSALASAFAKRGALSAVEGLSKYLKVQRSIPHTHIPSIGAGGPRKDILETRLNEVSDLLRKQQRIGRAYSYASSILTFGQFVIGGLLTTSFLQDHLSKSLVGVFGLLVLVSSLIRQYYRPDVQASAARERAVRLKALIRNAENQIALLEEDAPKKLSRQEIITMLTQGLNEIEESELRDVQRSMRLVETAKTARKKPPKAPGAT